MIKLGGHVFPKAGENAKDPELLARLAREMGYQAKGHEVMARFAEFCKEYSDVEKGAKFEGRSLTMILSPKTDRKK